MKNRTVFLLLAALFIAGNIFSQTSLYIPRNIQRAYEKGTRSFDGKPGKNYWTNSADYTIKAELVPSENKVKGHAWITYYNNSPDSLSQYVIRLYGDVFRKGNSRDFRISPDDLTDGVSIDSLTINGIGINFQSKEYRVMRTGTNLIISNFPKKIGKRDFSKIEIQWSIQIPKNTRIRMGAYSDTAFYVAYWYPQVAVYDDIDGWDRVDYNGMVEFYNDINNYDVEITVPKEVLVWATGQLQNSKELLRGDIYNKYQAAQESDEVVRIVTEEDYKSGSVTLGNENNVWKFKADKVPDFSFATAKGYLWDGASAEVDYSSGRRVFTDAVYSPEVKGWDEVAFFAKLSVEYLSHEWPGIPFPYPKITTFNGEKSGGGGMETPMMCNNGKSPSRAGQIGVTLHEIAHTYFPFYMGTNERKYAWMDEGWATFLTPELVKRLEDQGGYRSDDSQMLSFMLGNENLLPLVTPSYAAKTQGYSIMAYQQPAAAYNILRDFLGDELFRKALQEYMNLWNGKHPIPYDFFFTFDRIAGEDLSWFWKPWFFESGWADLAITSAQKTTDGYEVLVNNGGNYPVPIDLKITFDDNTEETLHKTASVWKKGEKGISIPLDTEKKIKKLELDRLLGPDSNSSNNVFEIK